MYGLAFDVLCSIRYCDLGIIFSGLGKCDDQQLQSVAFGSVA